MIRIPTSPVALRHGIALTASVLMALTAQPRLGAQALYTYTVIVPTGAQLGHNPALNNSGQVGAIACSQTFCTVYRGDGTTLAVLGEGNGLTTHGTPSGNVSINESGAVAYFSSSFVTSSHVLASDGAGFAFAVSSGSTWLIIGQPTISDQGQVVFPASRNADGATAVVTDATFIPLAIAGDAVTGGALTAASGPLINNSGQVAFIGATSNNFNTQIFRTSAVPGGTPTLMAPASAGGMLTFGMNDAGTVGYYGTLGGWGTIFTTDGVTSTPVVTSATGFQVEPHIAPINNAGAIAFQAGDGTGEASANRILMARNGTVHTVLRSGDVIPGLGTVLNFSMGNQALNDHGQVALVVRYDDGSGIDKYGIVRADPVNVAPVSEDSDVATNEDETVAATLGASDANGDVLAYSMVSNGSLGTATITDAATGAFSYTPHPDVSGTDTFTFRVNDGLVDSNDATVTVTILPVNDPPVAVDGGVVAVTGSAVAGVLQATDVDNPALTYAIVSNGTMGTAVITNPDTGAFTYTPTPTGGSGGGTVAPFAALNDTVTFTANDGTVDSNIATVTVTLRVDEPPFWGDLVLTTREHQTVAGRLTATNLPAGRRIYELVSQGQLGTVRLTSTSAGTFVYRPRAGVHGTDQFSLRVRVGRWRSTVAVVTVTIQPRERARR